MTNLPMVHRPPWNLEYPEGDWFLRLEDRMYRYFKETPDDKIREHLRAISRRLKKEQE